jgi:hypothetical protein
MELCRDQSGCVQANYMPFYEFCYLFAGGGSETPDSTFKLLTLCALLVVCILASLQSAFLCYSARSAERS